MQIYTLESFGDSNFKESLFIFYYTDNIDKQYFSKFQLKII